MDKDPLKRRMRQSLCDLLRFLRFQTLQRLSLRCQDFVLFAPALSPAPRLGEGLQSLGAAQRRSQDPQKLRRSSADLRITMQ